MTAEPPHSRAAEQVRAAGGGRPRQGEAANPAPPTVQRVRLRFAKRGRLRFLSHRDVARSFERAVRRAAVPVAYSHGFSPHPRLSWVGAAPTGTASEAEYLEIGLTRPVDPAALVTALDAALPDGLDVLEAAVAERARAGRPDRRQPLAARAARGAPGPSCARRWPRCSPRPRVVVERVIPSGRRTIDVRAAVVAAEVLAGSAPGPVVEPAAASAGAEPGEVCAIMTAVVRQLTPAVRPDDVLGALDLVAGLTATGAREGHPVGAGAARRSRPAR